MAQILCSSVVLSPSFPNTPFPIFNDSVFQSPHLSPPSRLSWSRTLRNVHRGRVPPRRTTRCRVRDEKRHREHGALHEWHHGPGDRNWSIFCCHHGHYRYQCGDLLFQGKTSAPDQRSRQEGNIKAPLSREKPDQHCFLYSADCTWRFCVQTRAMLLDVCVRIAKGMEQGALGTFSSKDAALERSV